MSRRFFAAFSAAALGAGVFLVAAPVPAGAHVVDTAVTYTCTAYPDTSLAGPQPANFDLTFHATAQDSVENGEAINAVVTLDPIVVPTEQSGTSVNNFSNISVKIPVPANSAYASGSLSGNTGGWSLGQSAGVITVSTGNSYAGGATITPPQINLNFTATGVAGTTVALKLGGNPPYNDSSNPSLSATTNVNAPVIGALDVFVKCFAPSPVASIHATSIVAPDTDGPAITITTPADGASYPLGATVLADYACTDQTAVAMCTGSVADGSPIDTSTGGPHTFVVDAEDTLGFTSSSSVAYNVTTNPLVAARRGTASEGDTIDVGVTLSRSTGGDVTVDWQLSDGTATDLSDYVDASGQLTFLAGGPLTQTVSVATIDDDAHEGEETFAFGITGVSAGVDIATPSVDNRIADDDAPAVGGGCGSATEGGTITCTATLLDHINAPVTVNYATADTGSATAPTDYTTTIGSLTFLPDGYPLTQSFTVATLDDAAYEVGDVETFAVNLAVDAPSGDTSALTAAIVDNDTGSAPPVLGIGDAIVREGDGVGTAGKRNAKLSVTLNKPATTTLIVNYSTVAGTATAAVDYQAKVGKTIKFNPGQQQRYVTVTGLADSAVEGDEAMSVVLNFVTGGAVIGDGTGTVTFVDDDSPTAVTPQLAIGDVNIVEPDVVTATSGTVNASVSVVITPAPTGTVTVQYSNPSLTGTASYGDYVAPAGIKTLTFRAGNRAKYIVIKVKPDLLVEGDETIPLQLLNATGATIADANGVVRILDNDDDTVAPDAPTPSAATSTSVLGGVDVSWIAGASGGRAITGYEFSRSTDGGLSFGPWTATGSGVATAFTDGGCGAGVECQYSLRALNGSGTSLGSSFAIATGLADLDAPAVSLVSPLDGSNAGTQSAVAFAGDSGIAGGDLDPVTVRVYAGADTSGTLVATLDAAETTGEFTTSTALAPGVYTAVASQSDWAGNEATSTESTFEVHDAVFVAPGGSDAAAGTADAPKATVQAGLATAALEARPEVLVANGTYDEGDGIEPVAAVAVRGGFDPSNGAWTRDGNAGLAGQANEAGTAIEGVPQAATITGTTGVVFDSVTLKGKNAGLGASSSVYGIRALGGADVALVNSAVTAQAGTDGVDGADGTTGGTGTGGGTGNEGHEGGSNCAGSGTIAGGTAGTGGTTSGRNGGTGGGAPCGTNGQAGAAGTVAGSGGGSGGGGGTPSGSIVCGNGDPGGGGSGGTGGAAGAAGGAGSVSLGTGSGFIVGNGTSGANGNHGHGGGGGGGGGGSNANIFGGPVCAGYDNGGSGGGGGGGGARGTAGAGGGGGGGSFAVYAVDSSVSLDSDSSATSGDGANGGDGGTGGDAGSGGNGGQGGTVGGGEGNGDTPPLDFDEEQDGGPGGSGGGGGGGGAGGGGGGGGSGPSIAVYHAGTGSVAATGTLARGSAGTPGLGGAGGGAGGPGQGGIVAAGNWTSGPNAGAQGGVGSAAANASAGAGAPACLLWSGGSCQQS